MEFDLYFHESRSQWPKSWNIGQWGLEVSKMSNTSDIWPLVVKWEVILKKRVLTYISEKVGRGDLNFGLQVEVTHMCHMAYIDFKYLH